MVVTPTASGKTLCYNLPVLNAVLENPDTRALYLFPTKALAQDQLAELHDLSARLDNRFGVFTYDGDTPADARKAIRERGHIVLSNPDMLHTGILPHHTRWQRLFENLRYIVLDELHTYRGVFGSHLANVLRRLRRIARFYGSDPQFICSSATIANPGELASRLAETEFEVIEENGAPAGEKFFVFYNPPVVNRFLGIRRSYINETSRVAQEFLKRNLQTIVFANSGCIPKCCSRICSRRIRRSLDSRQAIRGYRGGYLPGERREIEHGLREGRIRGVVSTNALELGIDVGSLDATIMAGYAGTIASTWQRAGRAGRRSGSSCAVLVASSAPLDQFIVQHPDYFFGRSPEHAFVQPDNLEILVNHLKCAAFELPIRHGRNLWRRGCSRTLRPSGRSGLSSSHRRALALDAGGLSRGHRQPALGDVGQFRDRGYHATDTEVIGEVDFSSALTRFIPKRFICTRGSNFTSRALNFEERKAYVKRVDVDYYTDAIRYTQVRVLEMRARASASSAGGADAHAARSHGDVLVRSQVIGFKKIKFFTNENVGDGKLELPENEMHTTAFWLTLERPLVESLPFSVSDRQSGMFGLLHALESIATLLLMCDARDLGTAIGERPPSPGSEIEWEEAPRARKPSPPWRKRNSSSRIFISTTRIPAASDFPSRYTARTISCWQKRAS